MYISYNYLSSVHSALFSFYFLLNKKQQDYYSIKLDLYSILLWFLLYHRHGESLLRASTDVTEALRRTSTLMQQELEKSTYTTTMLGMIFQISVGVGREKG